jgi:hypothetical protein
MQGYPLAAIIKNFFSVVMGVGVSLFILMALFPLFIFLTDTLLPTDDYGIFSPGATGSAAAFLLMIWIYLFIAGFTGGFACATISTRKDKIHTTIAGLVLGCLFVLSYNQDIGGYYYNEFWDKRIFTWGNPLIVLLAVYTGGLTGSWLKMK